MSKNLNVLGFFNKIKSTLFASTTSDKVDSEVPSTHEGKLVERLFEADDVVKVGQPFAILETEGGGRYSCC